MAEYSALETLTLEAAADLSNAQYHAVRLSAMRRCNVSSDPADNQLVGILLNKPRLTEFASIANFGKGKVVAGGGITAGQFCAANGSGRAVAATSGQWSFGRCLETCTADGEIITVMLQPPFRV